MDRDTLMEACVQEDYTTIREAGWMPIFEALKDWWAKRFSLPELKPYVDLLGSEDPDAVMRALRSGKGGEWRPSPSSVYRTFNEMNVARTITVDHAQQKLRPDQLPQALARVRRLMRAGTPVCECIPRPVSWNIEELDGTRWDTPRLIQFREDNRRIRGSGSPANPLPPHVIKCPKCHGIEQGQAFAAQDDF